MLKRFDAMFETFQMRFVFTGNVHISMVEHIFRQTKMVLITRYGFGVKDKMTKINFCVRQRDWEFIKMLIQTNH